MAKIEISMDRDIGFNIDESLTLKLPRFYTEVPEDKKDKFKEIFLIYRLLKKYHKANKDQKTVEEGADIVTPKNLVSQNEQYFSIIDLYFSLIEDYQNHNLLLFDERYSNYNPKGNINWQKTMNKNLEVIVDNSVFYKQFYYNNLSFNYQHPVTILYACALSNISKYLDIKFDLPYDYLFLKTFENSQSNIRSILKKYKRQMFSDREKKIFALLEELYSEKSKIKYLTKDKDKLHYAEYFDLIWEKMLLHSLVRDRKKVKFPGGHFKLKRNSSSNQVVFSGLSQIPDIVVREDPFLLVLDAKNYSPDFEQGKGTPQTSDIIKQIFYKYFLSKEFHNSNEYGLKNIVNAFLFPSILEKEEKIRYLGKHSFKHPIDSENIGEILCFYVDFIKLRQNFLRPEKNYRDELVDFIIESYKKNAAFSPYEENGPDLPEIKTYYERWVKESHPDAIALMNEIIDSLRDVYNNLRVKYIKNEITVGSEKSNFLWFYPRKKAPYCRFHFEVHSDREKIKDKFHNMGIKASERSTWGLSPSLDKKKFDEYKIDILEIIKNVLKLHIGENPSTS